MAEPMETDLENVINTKSLWKIEGLHTYMGWVVIGFVQNKTEKEIQKMIYDFTYSGKVANDFKEFRNSTVDISIFSGFSYRKEL